VWKWGGVKRALVTLQILTALAEKRNAQPLPEIGKAHGLRLPPDDACLMAPTWQLPRPAQAQPQSGSALASGGKPYGSTTQSATGGPSAMEVDGGGSAYQLPAAGAQAINFKPRPPLDVHPGEATED
jgi:Transcription initiation factor IID, 31kD subunit